MRKIILLLSIIAVSSQLISCNTSTPENYFDATVLSCNMMQGFADEGPRGEFKSPSVKMVGNDINKSEQMKREDVLDNKLQNIESSYKKLKQLEETTATKEIIQSSLALYNYVLPVYKKEYVKLARMYDDSESKESIELFEQSIHDKYYPGFVELYEKLVAAGKLYASKYNINVKWDIRTSPY